MGIIGKKLKIGIIGVGQMGQYHVNVVNLLINRYQLVGLYDIDKSKAQEIATKFESNFYESVEELLKACEAVVVAVPTVLHFKIAKMALEAGIHVLIEKPITQSIEEAEELIHLAQSKGLILQVGHVERFNGAVQEISKIVNNPLFVEARRMSPFTPRVKDISVVLDLMIHDIDVVATLIKSPIIKINAMGNRIFSEEAEDTANVQFQFENGCIANLSASRATQNKIRTLSLTQEKSYIFLNYADQDIHIHRHASQAYLMTREEIRYSQESFIEQLYVHKDNPLKLEHIHFYETITQGATPIVSGEMDIKILKISHEIIDQIQKSNLARIQPIG